MKSTLSFLLTVALSALVAQAGQISPQQAEAIAQRFVGSSSQIKPLGIANGNNTMKVAYTATSQEQESNLLYVVNRGTDGGYVVVAGDDSAPEMVLGYSDSGTFDYESAPANLKGWLAEYSRQIEYMIANGITATQQAQAPTFDSSVAPLITSRWNQDEPYNDLCNGYYTGCVATAMAQVMNYHEWPVQGTGSHSYYDYYSGRTWSANFAATTYDWDNMLDTYNSSSSQTARTAVATLMLHCGVSVDMRYMQDASGAVSSNVPSALMRYFGYAEDAQILNRDYYTYDEWVTILKGELDASRPVLYSAQSTGGGHEFVIDGYNTNGYFHVNWGWGGLSDGYYLIATLNPYSGQGIGGGSESGFMYVQDMVVNVKPAEGDEIPMFEITANSISAGQATGTLGQNASLTIYNLANRGCQSASFNAGIFIETEAGEEVASSFESSTISLGAGYYYSTRNVIYTIPSTLEDGTYRIYPAYRATQYDSNGHIHVLYYNSQYVEMTVSGNAVTFTNAATADSYLETSDLFVTGNNNFTEGRTTSITVKLTNNGTETYSGLLSFAILGEDSDEFLCSGQMYDNYYSYTGEFEVHTVAPGDSETTDMSITIRDFTATEDYYRVAIINQNNQIIGTPVLVKRNNPRITCATLPVVENSDNVDANEICASVTLRNSSTTEYNGAVRALIYYNGRQTAVLDTEAIDILPESTADVSFTGSFPDAVVGETYSLFIYDCANGSLLTASTNFTVGTAYGSGIEELVTSTANVAVYPNPVATTLNITTGSVIEQVSVYSLTGSQVAAVKGNGYNTMQIDVANLTSGTYIVRIATTTGTEVKKVIKK